MKPCTYAVSSLATVKAHNAYTGIAWDGNLDCCLLFDENGEFNEGYYIAGLLAADQALGAYQHERFGTVH